MKEASPSFTPVFEDCHNYLSLLHSPNNPKAAQAIRTACKQSPDLKREVSALLQEANWRPHLVAALAVLINQDLDVMDEVWAAFDAGSWVSPQLGVVAYLRDPEFVQRAKSRVEAGCLLDASRLVSLDPLQRHVAAGPAGKSGRSAKALATLLFLLGTFPSLEEWHKGQISSLEVQELEARDEDNSAQITWEWLKSVMEFCGEQKIVLPLPLGAEFPSSPAVSKIRNVGRRRPSKFGAIGDYFRKFLLYFSRPIRKRP